MSGMALLELSATFNTEKSDVRYALAKAAKDSATNRNCVKAALTPTIISEA